MLERPLAATLTAVFLISLPALAADRVLVDDGRSDYEIVRVRGADKCVRMAVAELRGYLFRCTGARLRVTTTPTPGKPHVFVGPSPWAEKLGVSPKGLPPETLRIKTVGRDIALLGVDFLGGKPSRVHPRDHTQTGTLSAVYAFLERVARVRWYGANEDSKNTEELLSLKSDDLYVITPRRKRLLVPDMDVTETPAFSYRLLSYSPKKILRYLPGRRWRLGGSRSIDHSHAWFKIFPPEKYGDHPDYYAELNGKRVVPKKGVHKGWQVCTTNPDVIRIFAEAALAHFRANPATNMFSISPNDGVHFCQCPRCRALDVEYYDKDAGWKAGKPVLTDRMLTFYNAVTARVAKVCPDKFLGAYLYSFYQKPPQRVKKLHPNLVLFRTMNSAWQCVTPERRQLDSRKVTAWGGLLESNYLYEIFYWPKQVMAMPQPSHHLAIRRIRFWSKAGVDGTYTYVYPSWECGGPTAYLLAKLLWNPNVNTDRLLTEYYHDLYGRGADQVRDYYDRLEQRWIAALGGKEKGSAEAQHYATEGKNQRSMGTALVALEPFVSPGTSLIDEAAKRVKDARCAERLRRLRHHHHLMVHTVAGLRAAVPMQTQAEPAMGALRAFTHAFDKRQAVLGAMAAYAGYYLAALRAVDQRAGSPLIAGSGFYDFAKALLSARDGAKPRDLFRYGDFEDLPADPVKLRRVLRFGTHGGPKTVQEIAQGMAAGGKRAVHIVVPAGVKRAGGSFGFYVRVRPDHAYRLTFQYRSHDLGSWHHGTLSPSSRIRLIAPKRKKRVYRRWTTDARKGLDRWTRYTHYVRTTANTNRVGVQISFTCPGEYWVDKVRFEEAPQSPRRP